MCSSCIQRYIIPLNCDISTSCSVQRKGKNVTLLMHDDIDDFGRISISLGQLRDLNSFKKYKDIHVILNLLLSTLLWGYCT